MDFGVDVSEQSCDLAKIIQAIRLRAFYPRWDVNVMEDPICQQKTVKQLKVACIQANHLPQIIDRECFGKGCRDGLGIVNGGGEITMLEDIPVHAEIRVLIKTYDLLLIVNSFRLVKNGIGKIHRRERTIPQKKAVGYVGRINIFANHIALIVNSADEGINSARKINLGEIASIHVGYIAVINPVRV